MNSVLKDVLGAALVLVAAALPAVAPAAVVDFPDCGVSVNFSGPTTPLPEDLAQTLIRVLLPSTSRETKIQGVAHSDVMFGKPFQELAVCFCAQGYEASSIKNEVTRRGRWSVNVSGVGAGSQSPLLDWTVQGFVNLKTVSRMLAIERREGCFVHQQINASIENVRDSSTKFLDSITQMIRDVPPSVISTPAAELGKIATLRKKCASLGFAEQTDANTACVVKLMAPD